MKTLTIVMLMLVAACGGSSPSSPPDAPAFVSNPSLSISSLSIVYDPVTKSAINPCRASLTNTGNTAFPYLFVVFYYNTQRMTGATSLAVNETKDVLPGMTLVLANMTGTQECFVEVYEESWSVCSGPGCPPLPPLLASRFTSTTVN